LASVKLVRDESALGSALRELLPPDVSLSPASPEIGFLHRKLEDGDLYFLANTGNQPRHVTAKFRAATNHAELWDPFSGEVKMAADPGDLLLEPYESRLIFFSRRGDSPREAPEGKPLEAHKIDVSGDWTVTFPNVTLQMKTLRPWERTPELRYYSGTANYEKSFDMPEPVRPGVRFVLDFGQGSPLEMPPPGTSHSMRAYLDNPIREAAVVYVNESLAGYVWHPPFTVDISHFVRTGKNDIRILAGNTAVNELAGRALPEYRLLSDRYGARFDPQDMRNLAPLPSGMLGPVTLIETSPRP
jgi:hypothetical protein